MAIKLGATGITFQDNSVQTTAGGPVTTQYAIGSYVLGRPLNNTSYNNSTIAGTSLYAAGSQSNTRWDSEGQAMTFIVNNGSGNSLVNTGSWRCVSIAPGNGINSGLGGDGFGQLGLWVRYA
jgi:hypothetical protein